MRATGASLSIVPFYFGLDGGRGLRACNMDATINSNLEFNENAGAVGTCLAAAVRGKKQNERRSTNF
jgi:hypothetical protein